MMGLTRKGKIKRESLYNANEIRLLGYLLLNPTEFLKPDIQNGGYGN